MKKIILTIFFTNILLYASSFQLYTTTQLDFKSKKEKSPTAKLCPQLNTDFNLGNLINLDASLSGIGESINGVSSKMTNLVADTLSNIIESLTGNAMMMNLAIESTAYTLAMVDCAGNILSAADVAELKTCMSSTKKSKTNVKGNAGLQFTGSTGGGTGVQAGKVAGCITKQAGKLKDTIWECAKKKKNYYIDEIIKLMNTKIQAELLTAKTTKKECTLDKEIEQSKAIPINLLKNMNKEINAQMLKVMHVMPIYKSNIKKKLDEVIYTNSEGEKITLFDDFIIKSLNNPIYTYKNKKVYKTTALQHPLSDMILRDFAAYANFLYQYLIEQDNKINAGYNKATGLKDLLQWITNNSSYLPKAVLDKIKDKSVKQMSFYGIFYPNKKNWICNNGSKVMIYSYEPKDYFTKVKGTYDNNTVSNDEILFNTLKCKLREFDINYLASITSALSYYIHNFVTQELIEGVKRYDVKIIKDRESTQSIKLQKGKDIKSETTGIEDVDKLKELKIKSGVEQYNKDIWDLIDENKGK